METQTITAINETVVNSEPQTASIATETNKGSDETNTTSQQNSESVFNRSVIEANSEPNYRKNLEKELDEIASQEIWRVGRKVRELRK